MGPKPRLRAIRADEITPGMKILAPAVIRLFKVYGVTRLFDGTLYISLDDCNNRHMRRKPDITVWASI